MDVTERMARMEVGGSELIPEHMRDGMRRWIENGILPGGFLQAVLENDLMEALGRADGINKNRLFHYGQFLYSYAPRACYGSPDEVHEWHKQGGLRGLMEETGE